MPFRITEDDKRAAKALNSGSVDGARVIEAGEISAASLIMLASSKNPIITADSCRRATALSGGMVAVSHEEHSRKHRRIDNITPLVEAHAAYQEIAADAAAADQGAHEQPDEDYTSALFQSTSNEGMKKGCFRCERDTRRHFFGAFWIRHDGDKHYIVFTDMCGNNSEEQIASCPWCKRDFEEDGIYV